MSVITSIAKLEAPIQKYAWGSHTAIARIQGRPTPTASPEAELWIGDHPNGPSRVVDASGTTPFDQWCAVRGADALGASRERLPFMVKILAAGAPLSIQLHPNSSQAAEGYAREEHAGIARDDAERSYSDPNPKIETLCALEDFEALCGFRSGAEVRALLLETRSHAAAALLAEAEPGGCDDQLAGALFRRVLRLGEDDPAQSKRLSQEMTQHGERARDSSALAMWIHRLAAAHPGDRMLIAPLLLNHVVLEPGEALEMSPNTVHSYLRGTGVEVMTNSDNVVRGGLTRKHVDPDEFVRLLDTRASAPRVHQAPTTASHGIAGYSLDTRAFQIHRVTAGPAKEVVATGAGEPRVLLCVEGCFELCPIDHDASVLLEAGEAAFIPACIEGFELSGLAEGFLVTAGEAST